MSIFFDPARWYGDPAYTGPRWRRFPGNGWHLVAYEDGRWFVERYGKMLGEGETSDLVHAKRIVEAIMEMNS